MEASHPQAATTQITAYTIFRWSSLCAVPALAVWVIGLLQFALWNSADQRLYRAAAAAVREAVLPRASRTSVVLAVQRTLVRDHCAEISPNVELQINARPSKSRWIDCRAGDTVSVTLTADPRLFAPDLLRTIGLSLPRSPLRVTATMQKP